MTDHDYIAWHERLVPQATQVASKGRFRYCKGFGPAWIEGGDGACVWDEDFRRYIDWTCGLGALTLGHNRTRRRAPACYPLPSRIEVRLADTLNQIIPCAEMVRFLKTGTDATTACVRLARTYTGRSEVVTYGAYHGWADWSLDESKKGCPQAIRDLTIREARTAGHFWPGRTGTPAAVILEPVSLDPVDVAWLQLLRKVCDQLGIVLIFDEVITGIRMAPGGAQQVYGVTPDLCAIGKGMANGWPISAVCGKREIMECWGQTHISGTHFADPTCMRAAMETIETLREEGFWPHQAKHAGHLMDTTIGLIAKHGLSDICKVVGHPHWWCLQIPDAAQQTLWQQECLRRDIITNGSHFITLAHGTVEVEKTIASYDESFAILADAIAKGDVAQRLECEINTTVFRRH